MIQISIRISDEQFKHAQAALQHIPKGANKAIARAINRAMEGARTEAVKKIREEYEIRPSDIRKTVRIIRANPNNLCGTVQSKGGPIPLIKFNVSPKRPLSQKKKKPHERKVVIAGVKFGSSSPLPYSFLARLRNGHVGVFSRGGTESLPIKQRYAPAIPQMLGNESVLKYIEDKTNERLEKELRHQINYLFGGGK